MNTMVKGPKVKVAVASVRAVNMTAAMAVMMAGLAIAPFAKAQTSEPAATVTFSGGAVAAGVGFTWGSGVLHFHGKSYPFRVDGLSVNDIGVDHIEGAGEVYNLDRAQDFSGNYVAAGAGATFAGGGLVAALENQNAVIIHFHSTTQGLRLNLSANGVFVHMGD